MDEDPSEDNSLASVSERIEGGGGDSREPSVPSLDLRSPTKSDGSSTSPRKISDESAPPDSLEPASASASASEAAIEIDGAAGRRPRQRRLPFETMMTTLGPAADLIAINDSVVDLKNLKPPPGPVDERDYDLDELELNESRNAFPGARGDNVFARRPQHDQQESSISTATTEYRTFCEEFHNRLPEALAERDTLIKDLEEKLNSSIQQKDAMKFENEYLSSQVAELRLLLSRASPSGDENARPAHLSDFAKHERFVREDGPVSVDLLSPPERIPSDLPDEEEEPLADLEVPASLLEGVERLLNDEEKRSFESFKDKILASIEREFHERHEVLIVELDDVKERVKAKTCENDRLRNLINSLKSDNPDVANLRAELEKKYQKEAEELRTYFEQKCSDMEKNYSEEIFSHQSKKHSNNSSADSLNNCPDAIPFANLTPLHPKMQRSCSAEFQIGVPFEKLHLELEIKQLRADIQRLQTEAMASHERHREELQSYIDRVRELKADLQTCQNTIIDTNMAADADLELEKKKARKSENLSKDTLEDKVLSDPSADMNNLIALKEKIEADARQTIDQLKEAHAAELAALRDDNSSRPSPLGDDEGVKYAEKERECRSKRYEAFDKNRKIEDVIKERDELKRLTVTLQRVLAQLVDYFNLCEDELNNTFVGELLKRVVVADENFDDTLVLDCTLKKSDPLLEDGLYRYRDRKMHFAPNVSGIMTYIDPESNADETLTGGGDPSEVSLHFQNHLDVCFRRLRTEAQELVELSANRINKRLSIMSKDDEKLSSTNCDDQDDVQTLKEMYDRCEISRKELQASLEESTSREDLLRKELQIAMDKITELLNNSISNSTKEVISEGYGVVTHPRTPASLPPHPRLAITSPPPLLAEPEVGTPESARSLDEQPKGKTPSANHELARRLMAELEVTTRDKEDLQMQLEAANKQLRSTRQFLEEQATEREQERDEFQKELEALREENCKLVNKSQQHNRLCKEVEQLEAQLRETSSSAASLEAKKSEIEAELKASHDKSAYLRDIITNLEAQLESKSSVEVNALQEAKAYREIAEEREVKMNHLARELERLKEILAERAADEAVSGGEKHAAKSIACELDIEKKLIEQMRSQLHILVETIMEHTAALENLHEAVCSQSCSSPSEDVSIRNRKNKQEFDMNETSLMTASSSPEKLILQLPLLEITRLGDTVHKHFKAEEAALKRISDLEMQLIQLKDVSQELRTERDILQERMSEQSLKISSLQSRLDQTRHTAEAMRHQTTEELRLKLDEALSETQLLREALDSRDKQVIRLKSLVESTKKRLGDHEYEPSSHTGSNRESVHKLKKLLTEQQARIVQLEEALDTKRSPREVVADDNEKSLGLNIDEIQNCEKNKDDEKLSARTLSDVLSISEFDEHDDMIVRKAEVRPRDCISTELNFTLDPLKNQNKTVPTMDSNVFQRQQNDTDLVLSKESSKNCSFFPNKDASDEKNASIQPKRIDFSLFNPSEGSLKYLLDATINPNEIDALKSSLAEIDFDIATGNVTCRYIILELRDRILENKERLTALPEIENEMKDLKTHLQSSIEKMHEDKVYYSNKLDEFTATEQSLRRRLEDTLKELNILKEDFDKKERMFSELTEEKLTLQRSLLELEEKYKNSNRKSFDGENGSDLFVLEQTISEKNQQIDNLNANLDKLDNVQRELIDNKEYVTRLGLELENKCVEVERLSKANEELIKKLTKNEAETGEGVKIWDGSDVDRQLSTLNSKLSSRGKELSIKVFELERAKLEIIDLQKTCEEFRLSSCEKDEIIKQVVAERDGLHTNLKAVVERLHEGGNVEDLREKLMSKSEYCAALEREVASLRNTVERFHSEHGDNKITTLSIENTQLRDRLYALEENIQDQNNLIAQLNSVKDNLFSDITSLQEKREAEKDNSARLKSLLNSEKQLLSNVQAQDSSVIQLLKGRLEESLDSESELKMMLQREKKNSERLTKQVSLHKKQVEQIQSQSPTSHSSDASDDASISALTKKLANVTSQYEDQVEITELLKSEVMLQKTKFDREKSRLLDLQNILDREKLWFQKEIDVSKEQISILRGEVSILSKQKADLHVELQAAKESLNLLMTENVNLENRLASFDNRPRMEDYLIDDDLDHNSLRGGGTSAEYFTLHHLKEMHALLKRHISENVQISQTVKELNQERKELQNRIRELEGRSSMKHATSMFNMPSDVDQQVRFYYGRYIRMHSYRKQLVFQKQYLMKVVSAYSDWESKLTNPSVGLRLKGKPRFRIAVIVVTSILRMQFLVKKWHTGNKLVANMNLNLPNAFPTSELRPSKSYTHLPTYVSGAREKSARLRSSLTNPVYHTPPTKGNFNKSWSASNSINFSNGLQAYATRNTADLYHHREGYSSLNDNRFPSPLGNSQFVRASQPEIHELPEERYNLLRSPTSDNGASSASRYLHSGDFIPKLGSSRDQL